MRKIKVKLTQNSYPILIGDSVFSDIFKLFESYNLCNNILTVIDENVFKYHKKTIKNALRNFKGKINYYLLKPGEFTKSYRELNKLYSFLLSNNYGRDTLIIAIGGGVTGDLTGYAAATFMRGVQLIHVPTTLLAAVDSSIGGKTGINFENKKNMVGAFYQPELVVIDTDFLITLPKREIISGMGEIIKYAYLSDNVFYNYLITEMENLLEQGNKNFQKIIYQSVLIKASVVSQDEKELGIRKILNFGHTFGHAFESGLKFKIKHGEAVIAGIISALFLSHQMRFISDKQLNSYLSLPLKIKIPLKLSMLDISEAYSIMMHDKKNRDGKIKFVLLSNIGEIILDVEATKKQVYQAIKETFDLISSQ